MMMEMIVRLILVVMNRLQKVDVNQIGKPNAVLHGMYCNNIQLKPNSNTEMYLFSSSTKMHL